MNKKLVKQLGTVEIAKPLVKSITVRKGDLP